MTVSNSNAGKCEDDANKLASSQEVHDRFALNVGIEGSYLESFSFSASSSYARMSESTIKQDRFYAEVSCAYSHVRVQMDMREDLSLDDSAQRLVDQIQGPLDADPKKWRNQPQWRFIEEFGTHYFDLAFLGGKFQSTYEVKKSYEETYEESGVSAAISAEANWGSGSVSGSVDMSTDDKDKLSKLEENSEKHQNYFGGSTDLQQPEDGREWQLSTYDNNWIVNGKVKPISNIIKQSDKREWVEDAVQQYILKTFVSNAAKFNVYDNMTISGLIEDLSGDRRLDVTEVEDLRKQLMNGKLYHVFVCWKPILSRQ